VGPSFGVDVCVVRIASGKVLVASTDPISLVPELGPDYSAWQSVNLIATDVATSGFSAQFVLFSFNLPNSLPTATFKRYWRALGNECKKLGISIVGGHTGKFQGLESTVIGAASMFAVGPEDAYITSACGRPGDKILLTKGAAVSSTAILARVFPNTIRKEIGEASLRRARKYLARTTAVVDALTAARMGANSLHDAAEGGVLAALCDLAVASKTGLKVDLENISISEETREICKLFRMDPYSSLSEGSLVISCKPSRVEGILRSLQSKGINTSVVGELTEKTDGVLVRKKGKFHRVEYPTRDPYWRAYYDGRKRGLS
jgi:hydrogenase expression/formation protein HypE